MGIAHNATTAEHNERADEFEGAALTNDEGQQKCRPNLCAYGDRKRRGGGDVPASYSEQKRQEHERKHNRFHMCRIE
jgi:hypothetical protein